MRNPFSELRDALQDQTRAIREMIARIDELAEEATPEELHTLREFTDNS